MRLRRLLPLIFVGIAHAQDQSGTIRTNVPLVVLQTNVTDRNHHPITGLTAADFTVLDEGQPRSIHLDSSDDGLAPVSLVIAIQQSDVSAAALAKIRKVGATVAEGVVGENAEAAVVTFGDDITVVQDFTKDLNAISEAFETLKQGENKGGRMVDAVAQSLKMLESRPGGRRSNIIIIGESRDRGSKTKLKDLLAQVQRSSTAIYSLTYSAYLTPFTSRPEDLPPVDSTNLLAAITEPARLAKKNTVRLLTDATGGDRLGFQTKAKLEDDLIGLGNQIHNRYILSFTPPAQNAKPGFHHLEISVKGNPDAVVRVRPGYYWSGLTNSGQ